MGLKSCKIIYNALSVKRKEKAIKFLKKWIYKKDILELRKVIKKDPEGWFGIYHHVWGTAVRNALRHNGYGEEYFGIMNLDDIYVELVEDAVND